MHIAMPWQAPRHTPLCWAFAFADPSCPGVISQTRQRLPAANSDAAIPTAGSYNVLGDTKKDMGDYDQVVC